MKYYNLFYSIDGVSVALEGAGGVHASFMLCFFLLSMFTVSQMDVHAQVVHDFWVQQEKTKNTRILILECSFSIVIRQWMFGPLRLVNNNIYKLQNVCLMLSPLISNITPNPCFFGNTLACIFKHIPLKLLIRESYGTWNHW